MSLPKPLAVRTAVLCPFQADVVVQLQADDGVDDATLNVVNSILEFIDSNPPKWQQWKEKAQQAGIEWA